jgi:hypothetical protein
MLPDNALADPSPIPRIRFALDRTPDLPASFTLDQTIAAISGHVIGRARLDGTYENP